MASKPKAATTRKILITTGDPDGVGWEVTAKALQSIGPKSGIQFVFYRHTSAIKGPKLSKFHTHVVTSLESAAEAAFNPKTAIEIRSAKPAGFWVEEAAIACMAGKFAALVTAPLSKTSIIEAGLKDIGHTEILARVSGRPDLFMGFVGRKFNVVLATGHAPLKQALLDLNDETLRNAFAAARDLRSILPATKRKLPIAMVGLNPHAGEAGLLGKEEVWFKQLIERSRRAPNEIAGPLVPDAAFLPSNWPKYSVYVCPYHDQGLIPFKMAHGFESGVHLTLGLPFVRTSVDHGTAKEIFGKNKARPGSMKDAVLTAIRLTKEKNV